MHHTLNGLFELPRLKLTVLAAILATIPLVTKEPVVAIQEKTFQSGLPDLLSSLFGQKTKTTGATSQTTTSGANTAPLEQVFANANTPMDQAMYDQLIGGIFGSAAQQVPELTAALANATGSRSSNNSPLALALNEQNNLASKQAAQTLMTYNQNQQQIAGNAAKGIADSTRTQNTTGSTGSTQKQGTGVDPLVSTALGFGLNQLDKRGGLDKIGSMVSSGFDNLFGNFDPVNVGISSDYTGLPTFAGAGADTSFLSDSGAAGGSFDNFFSGASDLGSDFVSGAGDFLGSAGDYLGDFASDAWGGVSDFFGFADGGRVGGAMGPGAYGNPTPVQILMSRNGFGYADGGSTAPRGMLAARTAAPMQVADHAVRGGNPNALMQQLLMQSMMPQQQVAPAPNPLNFLRYLLPTSDFNIYGYANGGGVRNRNNMGAPVQRTGMNAVDGQQVQQRQQSVGPGMAPGAGGGGGAGVTSTQMGDMIRRATQSDEQRKQSGSSDANSVSDSRAASIASMNAADGYASRDRTLAAFASLAAGIAAPALMGPEMAQALSLAGVTASPIAALNTAIQAAIQGNAAVGAQNAVNASSPVGGAVAVGGPANEGMSVSPDAVDSLGLTANMSQVAMPGILSRFGGDGGYTGSYGDRGPAGSSGDGHDQGEGPGGYSGPGGYGGGGGGSFGGGGDGQGDGGGRGSSTSGGAGGPGSANGGLLKGPGTGTSDSIKARSRVPGEASTSFSNGEFIMSRDAVEFYGEDFFNRLLQQVHTPVRR